MSTTVNVSLACLTLLLPFLAGSTAAAETGSSPDSRAWVAKNFDLWPWGIVCLILGALVLLTIAGSKLEYERLKLAQVQFSLSPLEPELGDGGWVQHVQITNMGPAGDIRVNLASFVSGISKSDYGTATIGWEQAPGDDRHLGRDQPGNLRLALCHRTNRGNTLRFWIPGGQWNSPYAFGSSLDVTGDEVVFDLDVRHVQRDVSRRWHAALTFSERGKPSLTLAPVGAQS